MHAERHVISVTTAADGTAVAYSPVVTGAILTLAYVKTDFADGVDFDVTLESTGEVIWDQDNVNASVIVRPRTPIQDTAGVDATIDGTRKLREPIVAARDRVKIAIANGGATKTGAFHVVVGG